MVNKSQDIHVPYSVAIRGRSLIEMGRFGCGRGAMSAQFIAAPRVEAASESISIGCVIFESSLWMLCSGEEEGGVRRREMIRRDEYEAVRRVAAERIRKMGRLVGLSASISRIRSFE